ncbi:M3 family oligoendopeptidase [Clostridiaceae bacterium 35-E11]
MKFKQYTYKRPDMKIFEKQFNEFVSAFVDAEDAASQDAFMMKINQLRNEFESMEQIAYIRHTINTKDAQYQGEQEFFDEQGPIYEGLVSKYYKALTNAKHKEALRKKWGEQLFTIASLKQKTFSPAIIEDLQVENKLMSEYTKLLSSAQIFFEGEYRNLPQMRPFEMSTNRAIRKQASEAKYNFFKENEARFDEIYDQLVKVRTKMAQKLGYKNFIPLGYARMLRSDYTPEMVKKFRDQVKNDIVPFTTLLRERQRTRLNLDKLRYYDEVLSFNSGNPKPCGDADTILEAGKKMYEELSQETKIFFDYMKEHELMDLISKEGKSPGGYCTFISKFDAPFIFSNFNGTADDIDVLTHEAGHAFQMYESRTYRVPEYQFPTLDACEIHSMSMEFFAWPWMELFFKEDAEKYRFAHLNESLLFIPYGVTVDEYQHFVYANPQATPTERKQAWRQIEKKYLPHRDYEDEEYLEKGGYWHQQGHIFKDPFYYIDYTLAGICAFQFWKKSREDWEQAWKDYVTLCRAGGSQPFLNLVESAKLISPFEEGCIKAVVEEIDKWLAAVNDGEL